jgi:hypothetical protein
MNLYPEVLTVVDALWPVIKFAGVSEELASLVFRAGK